MKNHGLSKKGAFLLCSALYCMERRGNSCTIKVFFLKKRDLVFNLTILSIFYSLFKRSTQVLTPKSPTACSSYNLRNMVEYKDKCQVIIFFFFNFILDLTTTGVLLGDQRRENMPTWNYGIRVGDFATAWGTTLEQ